MGDWQPIETAPKDGTEILVCVSYNLGCEEDGYETKTWVDWALEPYVWPQFRDRIDIPFPPTHWMPLPSPPTTPDSA